MIINYCIKGGVTHCKQSCFNSTDPCINMAIHVLLMHWFLFYVLAFWGLTNSNICRSEHNLVTSGSCVSTYVINNNCHFEFMFVNICTFNDPLWKSIFTGKVKAVQNGEIRLKIGFQHKLSLNAGWKYGRMLQMEHSAILLTFIKLPFVIKIFVLSIFERPIYTGVVARHISITTVTTASSCG